MDQQPVDQPSAAAVVPPQPPAAAAHAMHPNALMAILSYIGPLVVVSYLLAKDDETVKFHVRQGAVLFVIEVAIWILSVLFWFLWPVWQIANLGVFILSIVGIVNAYQGKQKELPLVGHLGVHVPL